MVLGHPSKRKYYCYLSIFCAIVEVWYTTATRSFRRYRRRDIQYVNESDK